jgi:hypothetical protein
VFVLKECHILQAPCTWIGPKAIGDAIRDNGALFRTIMASEEKVPSSELSGLPPTGTAKGLKCIYNGQEVTIVRALKDETNVIEWIDRVEPKAKGALSSANLLHNDIPFEQAQELVDIMRSKENLTTLCGLSREETKLDFSGQNLRAGDAVLIANDISDMGALLKIDLSQNQFGSDGIKPLLQLVQEWGGWQQMDGFNLGGNPGAKFLVHPCRSFMLHDPSCWVISQALPISLATAGGWKAVQQSLLGDLCCKRGRKAAMIRWIVVLGCIVALLLPQCWTADALQGCIHWHNTTAITSHLHQEKQVILSTGTGKTTSAAREFDVFLRAVHSKPTPPPPALRVSDLEM